MIDCANYNYAKGLKIIENEKAPVMWDNRACCIMRCTTMRTSHGLFIGYKYKGTCLNEANC